MSDYNDFAKTFSKSRKNLKWQELDTIIRDILVEKYASILDVGAGNGRFLEFFRRHHPDFCVEYLGVDSSSQMIQEARDLYVKHDFLVSPMQDVTFECIGKRYDAIVFLASFHHLRTEEERIQVLENFRHLLAQNGKIYMTNWNLLEQERYTPAHLGNGDFSIKIGEYSRYYHGFSLEELENIFLLCGYTILEHRIFEGGRNIFSVLQ